MLLSDLHWKGQDSLEEICIWGIGPMKELNEILSEYDENDQRITFLYYELRGKLEQTEKALCRFINEMTYGNVSVQNQQLLKKIPGRAQKEAKELLETLAEKYAGDKP